MIFKTVIQHIIELCLHGGILFGHKKEENFTLCDSMDGAGEYYAKWNKSDRER